MSESFPQDLIMWAGAVLGVWSIALLCASWRLMCMARKVAEQRREIRRWRRLMQIRSGIYERN